MGIKKILFVCTGNICRSPMAEYYLQKRLKDKNISGIEVESAGVFALDNSPVSSEIKEIMESLGVSIGEHRSSPLTLEKLQNADLILVMENTHKILIGSRMPQMAQKVKLLGCYLEGNEKKKEITDPYGCERDLYQQSFEQIREAVENLLKEIVNK